MPAICFDENLFAFPLLEAADKEGLLLIGGRPTPARVVEAYTKGIFPWYNDDALPLWWSPDPRFVLFPDELHTSQSMKKTLKGGGFVFKTNTAFGKVISACSSANRKGQDGTWITPAMQDVYTQLHYKGAAHSAEAWKGGQLVGGMYGLRIGGVFFGESMFSNQSNASKFAFINYVKQLKTEGIRLIDCQVYSEHVETLGARLISRVEYLKLLQHNISAENGNKGN